MRIFKDKGKIKKDVSAKDAILDQDNEIVLGVFVNKERKDHTLKMMNERHSDVFVRDRYKTRTGR